MVTVAHAANHDNHHWQNLITAYMRLHQLGDNLSKLSFIILWPCCFQTVQLAVFSVQELSLFDYFYELQSGIRSSRLILYWKLTWWQTHCTDLLLAREFLYTIGDQYKFPTQTPTKCLLECKQLNKDQTTLKERQEKHRNSRKEKYIYIYMCVYGSATIYDPCSPENITELFLLFQWRYNPSNWDPFTF